MTQIHDSPSNHKGKPAAGVAAAAQDYLKHGFQPIPLHGGLKPVKGFNWSSEITSIGPEDVDKWFAAAKGIALRCGKRGGYLVVVDLDCEEAQRLAPHILPPTELTWGRKGRATHYAYRVPADTVLPKQRFPKKGKALVEILGDGCLCDVPPTVKPDTGEPVEFSPGADITTLPEVPVDELLRSSAELATACYLRRHYPDKGDRHNFTMHAAGALYHSDWSREAALRVIQAVAKAAGDDEDRLANVHSAFDSGENDLPVTGWPVFLEWLHGDGDAAYEVSRRAADQAKPDKPETPHDIDYVARLIKGSDWDTLEFPPRIELVKGVFWEKSLNMVWGDTGIGKSWFALELGLCIAQGRDFLAWETTVEKRPIIYIDAELTPDQLQQRIIGLTPGKRPDHFLVYSVLQHAKPGEPDFNINSQEIQKEVEQMVAAVKPALIVFDNLSKLVKGFNKNDGHDWEGFLTWCDNLRATGPAILIVHHANKSGDQSGSKVQEIGLETNIELKRTGDQCFRIGFKKTRNQPPTPNTLEVEIKTEDGITTLEPGEWTPQADDHTAAVVCTLADGYSGTQKGLAKKADVHESSVKRIVPKLRANGYLPEKGWTLTAKGKEFATFSCGWGLDDL